MSPEDTNFRVAFLVDARRRVTPTDKPTEADAFARGVRLCVLKLLSYFAHARDGSQQAIGRLRWGLKVFHSYDYPPCKRDYLKELSLKHFQDFEDQLAGELDSLSSSIRGRRAPKTPQVLAATSVRQALDDVIHDFQWDGPDVCSPVKRDAAAAVCSPRRRTRSTHGQRSDGAPPRPYQARGLPSKCVFLLMPCPVSRSELEEFCDFGPDDPLPSSSEFLEMVLPRGISHQTFQEQSIALFWIDTSPWIVTEKRNNDGLSIVSSAMAELGGCIIPVHALVAQSQHITASLQSMLSGPGANLSSSSEAAAPLSSRPEEDAPSSVSSTLTESRPKSCPSKPKERSESLKEKSEKEEKKRSCCACLPFPSVMNHYMHTRERDTSRGEIATKVKLCFTKDGQVTDLCLLEVCPLLRNIPGKASPPRNPRASPAKAPSSTRLAIVTPAWSQTFDLTRPESPDPSKTENMGSPTSMSKHSETAFDSRVTLRAKFPAGAIPLSQYQASAVYTCTGLALNWPASAGSPGAKTAVEGRSQEIKLSAWFKDAMVSLSQQRKVLLVDMPHPETSVPVTAVLEPLTSTSASLRVLKPWPVPGPAALCRHVPVAPDEGGGGGQPKRATRRRSGAGDVAGNITRIAKEAARRLYRRKEWLGSPRGVHQSSLSLSPSSSPCDTVSFRPHLLEPWFSYCPSGGASSSLIDQLQSIPYRDKRPEPENPASVNHILQQLEEVYSRQPGTVVGPQGLAVKNHEQGDVKTETQAKSVVDTSQARQSPGLQKRKSKINIGFRTERIMQNSMRIQTTKDPSPQKKKNEKETRPPGSNRSKAAAFECPKFDSEQDVIDCIQGSYDKSISEGSCAMDFVQFTTSLVLSYMKKDCMETNENDPVGSARDLLTRTLLASSNQLRDKYQARDDEAGRLGRVWEIELQVLLRLEMEAVSPTEVAPGSREKEGEGGTEGRREAGNESSEDDGTQLPENVQVLVDEIVKLLRAVPFLADLNRLTTFMAETLLHNYADSLPHILRAIYDDLMQPVPSVLLSPGSDDTAVSSVRTQPPPSLGRPSSHGSFAEPSVSSVRTRSLARHPSLADMGSRRVIPVPSRNAAKKKEKPKAKAKEDKDDGSSSAKTVRRNLFMGGVRQSPRKGGSKLQRRQSVAVMQTIPGTRNSPRRRTPNKKDKAGLVLKTRVVKETPGKKQVLQAMLKKQERARRISSTSREAVIPPTPMRVVEESPLKPLPAVNVRRSPRIKPRNPGDRRSFYSSSCNDLAPARDLALRIAGKKAAPAPARPLEPAGRKSLLSEICSPGSLSRLEKAAATAGRLSSPRGTRSQIRRTPSKDSPGERERETEISPADGGKEEGVFKTPTRAPRRINSKSPAGSSTASNDATADQTTRTATADPMEDSPVKNRVQLNDAAQVTEGTKQGSGMTQDEGSKSPEKPGSSPTPRSARKSSGQTLASPGGMVTRSLSPTSTASDKSRTPDKQEANSGASPKRSSSVPIHGDNEYSGKSRPDGRENDRVITPSRRSKRLRTSPVSDRTEETTEAVIHPEPQRIVIDGVSEVREKIPRTRKRTLADRSPSPIARASVNTPSPQTSPKSVTPSSLQKWQRRKKPRRDSPQKPSCPVFPKATPPSAKRKTKATTPSPTGSLKFGRVTPYSERRKRAVGTRSSTKKHNQGPVTGEGAKGTVRQYKLGKVRKANVNLLTLMKDLDVPNTGKIQTRSRSSESASNDPACSSAEQQTDTYTFLDSHLDDSDDDIDFPKIISPLRLKTQARGSPDGVGKRSVPRSPELPARSSISVFLSEEDTSISTEDEVFPEASPSNSKRQRVTTPLTTGGLFELMNSPMVASGQKRESARPKVAFHQSTRKGGRQLYPTESQSASASVSHTMGRRSSSLGLRRLSSGSPSELN